MLSVKDVAEKIKKSEQTIRRYIKGKKLTAYKIGREWRINPSDLQEFIKGEVAITCGKCINILIDDGDDCDGICTALRDRDLPCDLTLGEWESNAISCKYYEKPSTIGDWVRSLKR